MAIDDPTPTSRYSRTARIGGLVAGQSARVAGGRAVDRLRSDEAKERAQRKRTAAVVEQIVVQLGQMKGAAMKLGQVLSTVDLPGMEPEDAERIKLRLAELRDNAPRVDFPKLEKLMAQEWGEKVGRVMREIDPEAVAAASIGQVHRGVTKDGQDVAIKVQYPGIAEAVESDLRNLKLLIPLLGRIAPGLDTKALAEELRERISEELDYELEAQNQRRVARGWRDHPHLMVPGVLTDLSTRRVLVTEFVPSAGFGEMRTHPDADRDRYAEVIHRFFHDTAGRLGVALGDPHPGNVLLAEDGRLAFIDFGMLRKLPAEYMEREGDVYKTLRADDRAGLRRTLGGLGYLPEPWPHADELLFGYMRRAAAWMIDDPQPRRLSGATGYEIMESIFELGPDWQKMVKSFSLPSEAVLLRRMEKHGLLRLRRPARLRGLACAGRRAAAGPGTIDCFGNRAPRVAREEERLRRLADRSRTVAVPLGEYLRHSDDVARSAQRRRGALRRRRDRRSRMPDRALGEPSVSC